LLFVYECLFIGHSVEIELLGLLAWYS